MTSFGKYQILHIPSGGRHVGHFNATQSDLLAEAEIHSFRTLEAEKLRLINTWNRQQPTTWKYWI